MSKSNMWRILSIMLILSVSSFLAPSSSDPVLLPKINSEADYVIDGNMTSSVNEWVESATFDTTIGSQDANIFVTSSNNSLYVGLNYTAPNFIKVNATSYNSTYGQNLDGHDWLALQFDNNLDKVDLGTVNSPDDVVVVNQFNDSIVDGLMTGNATVPFNADVAYNGTADGVYAFVNDTNDLTYEFQKPLNSGDLNGSDISTNPGIFQFRFHAFLNQTSNSTTYESTSWFTLRVNENGTGIALKSIEETSVNLNFLNSDTSNYDAVQTVLDQFGFDVDVNVGSLEIADHDLNIIIIPEDGTISTSDIQDIVSYVELGGNVILSIAPGGNKTQLYNSLGLEVVNYELLQDENSTDLMFPVNNLNSDLSFLNGDSSYTNKTVENVSFRAAAMNIENVLNHTKNPLFLRQDYMFTNIFDGSDLYYDIDDDEEIFSATSFNDTWSVGASFDLFKGGRLNVFSSSDIFGDEFFATYDNMYFLLRMMPWNARMVNSIKVHSVSVSTHTIDKGDTVSVTVNVTDEFGMIIDNLVVKADLMRAGGVVDTIVLTENGGLYTGEIEVKTYGTMHFEIIAFADDYGFAQGQDQQLFVANPLPSYNDFGDINFILVLIFLGSVALSLLTYLRIKKK